MDTVMKHPKITVLMPVYNAERFLREAMESILQQTFRDFELIVIDDGSTDESSGIISSFQDPRIRFEKNGKNAGLIATLNKGLLLARGEYIARMDADDISEPSRFAVQTAFLDGHPDIALVGSWIRVFGAGMRYIDRHPLTHEEIRAQLFFSNALAHPTVMFRRSAFSEAGLAYEEQYKHVEDYGLWVTATRMLRFANIPKPLLRYRVHNESVSRTYSPVQIENTKRIRGEQLSELGIRPTDAEMELHQTTYKPDGMSIEEFLAAKEKWLLRLIGANRSTNVYARTYFEERISERWFMACMANVRYGSFAWRAFRASSLREKFFFTRKLRFMAKFFVKSVIRRQTIY